MSNLRRPRQPQEVVATAAAAPATAAVAHRRAAEAATATAATTDTAATQQPQQPPGSHSNCSSHSCHRKTKETTTVKRGHDEPREVKNSSCKQCTKDRFPFLSSSGFRGGAPFAFKNHQFLQNSLKKFKIDYRSMTALFLLIKKRSKSITATAKVCFRSELLAEYSSRITTLFHSHHSAISFQRKHGIEVSLVE